MIRHKKHLIAVFVIVAFGLLLAGCQKQGKLDDGDCKLKLELTDMPVSFDDLPDNIKRLCEVEVTLKNISNEKKYTMHLNNDNGFKAEASLNPGIYQVEKCEEPNDEVLQFTPEIKDASITLQKGKDVKKLKVDIKDITEFEKSIKNAEPSKKIVGLDMFSRKIQIDGHVIAMKDILKKNLSVFRGMDIELKDINVEPNERDEVSGNGITVEVYNTSSKTLNAAKCKVLSIEITKNIAVLPKGVRFGMSMQEICNAKNGLYKMPDKCKGPLLLAYELDNITATYHDKVSGDKITITFNCDGWYINNIKYQFEVYEEGGHDE